MVCDIDVPNAMFKVTVITTVERIVENEIYAVGKRFIWDLPFHLVWRNFPVNSRQHALALVVDTLEAAENMLDARITAVLQQKNFKLFSVVASDVEKWELTLKEAEGERRTQAIEVYGVPEICA